MNHPDAWHLDDDPDPVDYTRPEDVSERDWAIYLARHRDGVGTPTLARLHGIRAGRVLTICRRVVFKVAEGLLATHAPAEALQLAEWHVPVAEAYREEWLWLREKRGV
jgi:hypothetical protein